MERRDVPSLILQSFQSLSVSPTSLVFGKELANSISPEEFVATVNQCLHLHSCNKVDKFHIYFCPLERFLPDIRNWVEFAVAKGVEELNLDLSMGFDRCKWDFTNGGKSFPLYKSLKECNTLSSLSLSNCDFCPSGDFSFCRLKSISLKYVSVSGDVLQSLVVNCPFLDSLSLRSCSSLESITVASHVLRRLTIVGSDVYQIQINAPQLESFIYYGEHIFDYPWEMTLESGDSFTDISSLSDAFVSSIGMEISQPHHDYIQLVYDLRHVKVLTICSATLLRVGTYEDIKFPIRFQNLEELQLLVDPMSMEYLAYLYQFFRLCPSPSLEKLFIQLPSVHEYPVEEFVLMKVPLDGPDVVFTNIKEVEDPSDIIFRRLRVIKMNKFKGCASEMRLVKFLLEKAIVLESMVLVAPPTPDSKSNMDIEINNSMPDTMSKETIDLMNLRRQISMFKTTSPGAQIILHEYLEDDASLTPTHTKYFCDF